MSSVCAPALYVPFCNEARCGCTELSGAGSSGAMLEVRELFRAESERE